jgi:hypothetical protein
MSARGKTGVRGCCRVYRRRTLATVRRATSTWCRIFAQDPLPFEPVFDDCHGLARSVKSFLGSLTGPSQEAVMAFQSIKKLLPSSCPCMEEGFLERLVEGMLKPSACLPDGYLAFACKVVSDLFPAGWDVTYRDHCYTSTPPLSSTFESSRADGGGTNVPFVQSEFLDATLGLSGVGSVGYPKCRPMVVQSAGKPRPLTKYTSGCLLLKPLHKAIYDRLSHFKWLLRGDLTGDALDEAGFRRGLGSLVSGDYSSATDNLPLPVARAILEVILRSSTRVPEGIRALADELLQPLVAWDGGEWMVSSGQQMGSLLSFPLLCLQNYVAFRWALRSFRPDGFQRFLPADVPVLINGDDILFQADDPRFFDCWVSTVRRVGLEVERTKTSFAPDYGSLNSTLLRWSGSRLRVIPTLRFGMLRSPEFPNSLCSTFASFVRGISADASYRAAWAFFSWHRGLIVRTGLSLRELGFTGRLAFRVWDRMGLWRTQRLRVRDGDRFERELPRPPDLHNYVLSDASRTVMVPESKISAEEALLNRRQMAAWKWSLAGTFKRLSSRSSYWVALSRPPLAFESIDTREYGPFPYKESFFDGPHLRWRSVRPAFGTPSRVVRRRLKELYFAPRSRGERSVPFFMDLDRLPSYDEAVERRDVGLECEVESCSKEELSARELEVFSELKLAKHRW